MGIGVSDWRLARVVSSTGQLGVVAGSGMDTLLARSLQLGDPDGRLRHALAHFPVPEAARRIVKRYFVAGGKPAGARFRGTGLPSVPLARDLEAMLVAAAFVQIFLACEGLSQPVGINLLEKIQILTLPTLYGAMLAGVGYVLVGAGVPRAIPGILDRFARGEPAELKLDVEGARAGEATRVRFDPAAFFGGAPPPVLKRPRFLAIVAADSLAGVLARKASGRVDGFVVEGPTAGGHNAPPRGGGASIAGREPRYGERDVVDLAKMRALGLPFWLAGSYGSAAGLRKARREGAAGIQVGTAFAWCDESRIDEPLKRRGLQRSAAGAARVRTEGGASPTGFPFKVVQLDDTLASDDVYAVRKRVCDVGLLRRAYRRDDGRVGWRCPAEPVAAYVAKGGRAEDCEGRRCLCNALLATVGLAQPLKGGGVEAALVTSGTDVAGVARYLRPGASGYRAADVLADLLAPAAAGVRSA